MCPGIPDTIQTIPDALIYWAEHAPEIPAFISLDKPALTYAELRRRASALAASLQQIGIRCGDRVVLLMPEGADLAVALLGTMSAAAAIPLNSNFTPPSSMPSWTAWARPRRW